MSPSALSERNKPQVIRHFRPWRQAIRQHLFSIMASEKSTSTIVRPMRCRRCEHRRHRIDSPRTMFEVDFSEAIIEKRCCRLACLHGLKCLTTCGLFLSERAEGDTNSTQRVVIRHRSQVGDTHFRPDICSHINIRVRLEILLQEPMEQT